MAQRDYPPPWRPTRNPDTASGMPAGGDVEAWKAYQRALTSAGEMFAMLPEYNYTVPEFDTPTYVEFMNRYNSPYPDIHDQAPSVLYYHWAENAVNDKPNRRPRNGRVPARKSGGYEVPTHSIPLPRGIPRVGGQPLRREEPTPVKPHAPSYESNARNQAYREAMIRMLLGGGRYGRR
jgi:hypothetical protein